MTVCVDASIILKLYLPEPDSELAEQLWREWEAAAEDVLAPVLIDYEVASVFRLQAHCGGLTAAEATSRFEDYRVLPIRKEHDAALMVRALELAAQLGQPRAYDSTYLALAERHNVLLWTADVRLWKAAQGHAPWVRRLGESKTAS